MTARIVLPVVRRLGEHMEIRILIQHPMDTGFMHDVSGAAIEKNVINALTLEFNGDEILNAELGTGTAANPFIQFQVKLFEPGEFMLKWVDDKGQLGVERAKCLF
jgi:sulfur-oxidizing protein SoxZ